jgi:hypothetical protein
VHALRGKEHIEYDNPFDVAVSNSAGAPLSISGWSAQSETWQRSSCR